MSDKPFTPGEELLVLHTATGAKVMRTWQDAIRERVEALKRDLIEQERNLKCLKHAANYGASSQALQNALSIRLAAPELLSKPAPAPLPALVHVTTDAAGHMYTVPAPAPAAPDLPRLRAELRAMLRGDIAFHTDPYTTPKK